MALVLTHSTLLFATGTYLRIDGIRYEPVPQLRPDGVWSVDPSTPVRFHVYAYQSATARAAGDAPISDGSFAGTIGMLGLLSMVAGTAHLRLGPAWRARAVDMETLWQILYGYLEDHYPRSINRI